MQLTTPLVQIGNSHGIRIPAKVVKALGLYGPVNLDIKSDKIIITPTKSQPRSGWADSFAKANLPTKETGTLPEDLDINLLNDLPW